MNRDDVMLEDTEILHDGFFSDGAFFISSPLVRRRLESSIKPRNPCARSCRRRHPV